MMRFFVLDMIYLYFIRNNSEKCVGIFFGRLPVPDVGTIKLFREMPV